METTEITSRTKVAVRRWASVSDTTPITLDDLLDSLRLGNRNDLRVKLNAQFQGQQGFPVSSSEWQQLELKKVVDVRNAAQKRVNGAA